MHHGDRSPATTGPGHDFQRPCPGGAIKQGFGGQRCPSDGPCGIEIEAGHPGARLLPPTAFPKRNSSKGWPEMWPPVIRGARRWKPATLGLWCDFPSAVPGGRWWARRGGVPFLMGLPRLRQSFPAGTPGGTSRPPPWEAGSPGDPCDLSQKVLWNGPQATTAALCGISTLPLRLERSQQHLLHSCSFCSVASVLAVVVKLRLKSLLPSASGCSFQAVRTCSTQLSFGKEFDIHRGQVWQPSLEVLCHFLLVH